MSSTVALRRTLLTGSRFRPATTAPTLAATTTAPRLFSSATAQPQQRTPSAFRPRYPSTPTTPLPPSTRRNYSSAMAEEGVHNLASKGDFDNALKEKGLMVLDCFATWCGPCKIIAPKVVAFSKSYTSARFFKLDVDEVPEVAQELSVRAMPTFLLFKDGEKVAEVVGANPVALEAAIKQHA